MKHDAKKNTDNPLVFHNRMPPEKSELQNQCQVLALKKARFGNDPIDIQEFKKLYRLDFPNLPKTYYGDVLEMVNGQIQLKHEALERLKENSTVTTSDPKRIEQLEAIENLVKQYDKVFSLCFGSGNVSQKHDFSELGFNRNNREFNPVVLSKFI